MEDRVKKYRRGLFISGFFGAMAGLIIYDILGDTNDNFRLFFPIIFTIVVKLIYDLYWRYKYPEIKVTEKILDKDERNILIRGKAAYVTMNITLFSLLVPMLIGIITENILLTGFSIALYFLLSITFIICKRYWSNRL